ncbi:hypothetical protein DACRYDRAFT_47579 [Dacryopinax primogenitus]|uniref:HD domain-containing protein n=1 Tax=Dacryopinax primogenitus (strain DJM 731) TaxID=1858805 RepID=M5G899_DACPD|nr:uncharacterized protein DACRYDRAFT_47579 [Dacryopinax primogenitus]EJU04989.1 hypothetical protein DACRYDRAFT_47579 [Dacryopinax primogenitus]
MQGYTPYQQELLKLAEQLMHSEMANNDPSHDVFHVLRVRKTAIRLADSLAHSTALNIWMVDMAALLHDINDHKYATSTSGTVGLKEIYERMSRDDAAQLEWILERVSWSKEKRRREEGTWGELEEACVELHCVQDADRLDAIGAFGIMRCAAFSAVTKRPLYAEGRNDTAIAHFHEKLLNIAGSLKTELGTQLGIRRHQVMLDFLASVDDEVKDINLS